MQMIIAVRECALQYLFSTCFAFYQKEGINQMWSMFGVLYAPIAMHLCIEIMCFIAKITINVVDRTNIYLKVHARTLTRTHKSWMLTFIGKHLQRRNNNSSRL